MIVTIYILIGTAWLAWDFVSATDEQRRKTLGKESKHTNFLFTMVAVLCWFPMLVATGRLWLYDKLKEESGK